MDLSTAKTAAKGRQRVVFVQDAAIDKYICTMLLTLMPGIDLVGVIIVNADCRRACYAGSIQAATVSSEKRRPRSSESCPWMECIPIGLSQRLH